jgi:hypothetical protein
MGAINIEIADEKAGKLLMLELLAAAHLSGHTNFSNSRMSV